MENWAPRFFTNESVAVEIMHFCIWNQTFLLEVSFGELEHETGEQNFFERYFPELLKAFLWHPHSLSAELDQLLPLVLSPKSFKEVLHAVLDLPLHACVLEGCLFSGEKSVNEMEQDRAIELGGGASSLDVKSKEGRARQAGGSGGSVGEAPRRGSLRETFLSFFWRSRSTVGKTLPYEDSGAFDGSLWSSRLLRMTAINFASSASVHVRACVVCEKAPELLTTALDVISSDADEKTIIDSLRVVLSRFSLLFGPNTFAIDIRRVILDWMHDLVVWCPRAMLSVRDIVFSVLSSSTPLGGRSNAELELVLHFVVMVGEHVGGEEVEGAAMFRDRHSGHDAIARVSEEELVKYYLVVEDVCARARDEVQARILRGGSRALGIVRRILSAAVAVVTKVAARCVKLKHRAQRFLLVVATQRGLPDAIAEEATEGARFLHLYGAAKRLA